MCWCVACVSTMPPYLVRTFIFHLAACSFFFWLRVQNVWAELFFRVIFVWFYVIMKLTSGLTNLPQNSSTSKVEEFWVVLFLVAFFLSFWYNQCMNKRKDDLWPSPVGIHQVSFVPTATPLLARSLSMSEIGLVRPVALTMTEMSTQPRTFFMKACVSPREM